MNIKVSGITSIKQLQQLDGLNVDFAGLVFHKGSPYYAGNKINPRDLAGADLDVKTVGIFTDADYEEIMDIAGKYDLDIIQLNGEESPELCEELSEDIEVIKSFIISKDSNPDEMVADYDDVCDYYLFDTSMDGKGKAGKFDWKIVGKSKIEKPFFISGGISPEDAALLKKFKHPDFYGADVNDLFEKEPGVKDMGLILKLLHGLK